MHPSPGRHPNPTDCLDVILVGGHLQRFAMEWEKLTSDCQPSQVTVCPPPFRGVKISMILWEPAKQLELQKDQGRAFLALKDYQSSRVTLIGRVILKSSV